MKIVLVLLAALAAVFLLSLLAGSVLPRNHVATRSGRYHRSPEALYDVARDFARQPRWRAGVTAIELLPDVEGRPRFKEVGRNGTLIYIVEEDVRGRRLVTRLDDRGQPFGGTWTMDFIPAPDGAVVRITERGFVRNPILRVISRLFFSPTATMEAYLRDLGREVGETVEPAPEG